MESTSNQKLVANSNVAGRVREVKYKVSDSQYVYCTTELELEPNRSSVSDGSKRNQLGVNHQS